MKKKVALNYSDIEGLVLESLRKIIKEGITFSKYGNTINGRIDSKQSDDANADFDTRIFGTKQNILYGDNTSRKMPGIGKIYNTKNSITKTYRSVIDYINNNRSGEIYIDEYTPQKTITNISQWLNQLSDEEIIRRATRNLTKQGEIANVYSGTYNRINQLQDGEKGERYIKGVVPGTNVEVISLFKFSSFNVSDFIKNGNFRADKFTDGILGIDSSKRNVIPRLYGRGASQQQKVPATYDNGIKPNLDNVFSYNQNKSQYFDDVQADDHFGRNSYGFQDDNYTSVSQFTDKSIMYAAYVMKKENINPNYIVAAPSSSKFNDNYCMRLATKTGVEYVQNFFKRNVINVVFDREGILNAGLAQEALDDIERSIRDSVFNEISNKMGEHVIQFFEKNKNYFNNINPRKYDREKVNIKTIETFVVTYAFEYLNGIITTIRDIDDGLSMTILNNLTYARQTNKINNEHLQKQIAPIIQKYLMPDFTLALRKMLYTMIVYRNYLLKGYRPNFENKKVKITDFPDVARPFLKDYYVIADKELSSKQGKQLFSRYKNAKFVIFDEDMQSGGTLKLLIQCMIDKNVQPQNITCIVQSYKE